jgi:O-acetylhomoserine (thiol)-lyase
MGSSGSVTGGAIIAKHNITSKFLAPEQKENYAMWTKGFPFRDAGCCLSPIAAYMVLSELKSLRIKVEHFSKNTEKVIKFLSEHPGVEKIEYLGLESHPLHNIAKKYMKLVDSDRNMYGHLFSFNIAGDLSDTRKFFDNLRLIARAFDLGKIKSVAVIPSVSTHKHQGEEGQRIAGIPPNMVRLCVGGENPSDIINDLAQALDSIKTEARQHSDISAGQAEARKVRKVRT